MLQREGRKPRRVRELHCCLKASTSRSLRAVRTYACLAADTKKRDTRRYNTLGMCVARPAPVGSVSVDAASVQSMHDACDSAEARADIHRGGHGMFHSRKCRKSQGKPRSYNLTHQPNCPRIYRDEKGLLRRRSHQMHMPILIRPRADALLCESASRRVIAGQHGRRRSHVYTSVDHQRPMTA